MQEAKPVEPQLHFDKVEDYQGVHKAGNSGERFSE